MTNAAPTALRDRFGIYISLYKCALPSRELFARVVEMAAAIESTVYDTVWLPDHLIQDAVDDRDEARSMTPVFDAPTMLGVLAAVTERVRMGALVSPITLRNPAVLAKSITTTDVVSGGRAVLGIGAGWDGDEHRRFGLDFPGPAERVSRLSDAVGVCRALFDQPVANYSGEFFALEDAFNIPRPVSEHVPILVGGAGRRTLRIAAAHADACNAIGTIDQLREAFTQLDRHCDELGRDPAEVSKQAGIMFHEVSDDIYAQVEAAFGIGADGVILGPRQLGLDPGDLHAIGERLRTEFG